MPPKRITCSICGKEISKRQSYLLDDGTRACKSHQEAQEAFRIRIEKEKSDKAKQNQRKEKKSFNDGIFNPADKRCFICRKKGLHQTDFSYRIMVALEKLRQDKHDAILLSMIGDSDKQKEVLEMMQKAMISPDATDNHELKCLFVTKAPDKENNFWKDADIHAKIAAQMMGAILVCADCAMKYKIALPVRKIPKNVSLDDIARVNVVYDQTIGKTITAEAIGELAAEDVKKMNDKD